MKNVALIFIICCNFSFFYLVPSEAITRLGPDLGLLTLFILLAYQIFGEKNNLSQLNVFPVWYVVIFLLFVLTQVSVASFLYSQRIIDGLIVSRNQFHYLIIPSMILAFKSNKDIVDFMKGLTIVALVLLYLGLINYFGPTIFQHRWAVGHGERSGIVRAYLPGMEIFVVVFFWHALSVVRSEVISKWALFLMLTFAFALVFRQTRMHIVASFSVVAVMMLYYGRVKLLVVIASVVLCLGAIGATILQKNIVVDLFSEAFVAISQSSADDRGDEKTTWSGRLEQIERSRADIYDTFMTGSGGAVLRSTGENFNRHMHLLNRSMDLGYFIWIKYYGVFGLLFLAAVFIFMFLFWSRSRGVRRREDPYYYLDDFCIFYFLIICISMITIGYMTQPHATPLFGFCLALAAVRNRLRGVSGSAEGAHTNSN